MQLLIILLLVLLNGLLAMSEIAVVSARKGRLKEQAEAGDKGAQVALKLAEAPNRFLSTVQIGITLVGVLAGAFGGATVGQQFGMWIAQEVPALAPYSEAIGVGGVVALTTYLSLVLGELVPKRLGIEYPEAIARTIAAPMMRLSTIMAPIVSVLSASTNGTLKVLGINPNADPSVTEAEVIHMIKEGADEGIFDEGEAGMVQGVFELDERRIAQIMTPRTEIHSLSIHDSLETIKSAMLNTPHSLYPVTDGNIDGVVGILKARDLLHPLLNDTPINLGDLVHPPLFIPEVAVASTALELFKSSGTHIAMVIGEHGGVEGLLTINDILEEIVGDIDADEPIVVQREDGSWLLDGTMPLTRFEEFLPQALQLPANESGRYSTLAGFVMARLGRFPAIADRFEYGDLIFEVVDMDGSRVDRILVEQRNASD